MERIPQLKMDSSHFSTCEWMFVGLVRIDEFGLYHLQNVPCLQPLDLLSPARSCVCRGRLVSGSCSSFHLSRDQAWPLSSSQNSTFQTALGLCFTVIGCDFPKPHFTLSLHHCQAALPIASEREAGAQWRKLSKHAFVSFCTFPLWYMTWKYLMLVPHIPWVTALLEARAWSLSC